MDLWNYQSPESGAGIRTALDFLIPYWTGQQSWQHDEITDVDAFAENSSTLKRAAAAYAEDTYISALGQLSAGRSHLDLLRVHLARLIAAADRRCTCSPLLASLLRTRLRESW